MTELSVRFGNWGKKERPEEDVAMGKYDIIIDTIKEYANEFGYSISDEEGKNVYMEMCDRKIGGFAHGWEQILTLTKGEQTTTVKARLEAHYFSNYKTYGGITIDLENAPQNLAKLVENLWDKVEEPLTKEEMQGYMQRFTKNKSRCYGLCKE